MNEYLKYLIKYLGCNYPFTHCSNIFSSLEDLLEKLEENNADTKKGLDFIIEVLTLYRDNIICSII